MIWRIWKASVFIKGQVLLIWAQVPVIEADQ